MDLQMFPGKIVNNSTMNTTKFTYIITEVFNSFFWNLIYEDVNNSFHTIMFHENKKELEIVIL